MNIWPLNGISQSEKNDILSKHKTVYNGYRAVQSNVPNTQPLYVQDFASDKEGMVINNKGVVKRYTNYAINESKEMCSECGGQMMEGECMECGMVYEGAEFYEDELGVEEGDCMECGGMYEDECLDCLEEDIYDVEDLSGKFDYIEEMGDYPVNEYDEFESAFSDIEEGEVDEMWGSVARMAAPIAVDYAIDTLTSEEDIEEDIDMLKMGELGEAIEEKHEESKIKGLKEDKTRILGMMNRMRVL